MNRSRILHVLASLSRGGIETWLVHMLRNRDKFSVEHEFLLTKEEPGDYEAEVRQMGIRIHKLPMAAGKAAWLGSFRQFLVANGPFAAVHSHVYQFSAPLLTAAKAAKVPIRIAHCHTARFRGGDHRTIRHKLRRAVAIKWLKHIATRRIGISEAAIEEIAGPDWRDDPTASVLVYGFDFLRYRDIADRAMLLRQTLGIEEDAPVIGHVGRFEPVKNHAFLLDAFSIVLRNLPRARLVLVGDGPVRDEIAAKAKALGIAEQVLFAGTSDDVPAYMRMFDLFVLPSLSEGLGIVCVEAQAAGTPAIVSDAVPHEALVVQGAMEFLPLALGADAWAGKIVEALEQAQPHQDEWLGQVERSHFAIGRCIEELDGIYRSAPTRTAADRPPIIFVLVQTGAAANGGISSISQVMAGLRHHRPIIVTDRESPRVDEWRRSGFETHVVPASRGVYRHPLGTVRSYWRYSREIGRLVKSSGAKVIHANDPLAVQLATAPAKLTGAKLVFNLRGTFDPKWPPSRLKYRLIFAAADHVLYLSHDMARRWAEYIPNAVASHSVTYSAADPTRFHPAPIDRDGERVVLVSGLVRPLKGQLEFIQQVAPKLAREGVKVWFAGDFDTRRDGYMTACVEAAAALGDSVRFLGYRTDIPELMAASSVIAVPSHHEGLVRAMIEGMSCARPVVSFDVCSAREILEDQSGGAGMVIQGGDYDGLTNAIIAYCQDRDLAADAGQKGRATALRLFARDDVVARYEKAYELLVTRSATIST